MGILIRPASPEDATFIAKVILLAARSHLKSGFWDIALGGIEEDCLYYLKRLAVTPTCSSHHYSRFILAEVDGCRAAGLCGFDPGRSGASALLDAMNEVADELGWSTMRLNEVLKRFLPISTCFSDSSEGTWVIENVATLPEFRRRGLITLLLNEILEIGKQNGHHIAQITIMIGNTAAQRAYEKAGFKGVDEKRHSDFKAIVGEPGMRRLLRDL